MLRPLGSPTFNGRILPVLYVKSGFKLHTLCYFQSLYPSAAQKHPAHTLSPFVDMHGQEAFAAGYIKGLHFLRFF